MNTKPLAICCLLLTGSAYAQTDVSSDTAAASRSTNQASIESKSIPLSADINSSQSTQTNQKAEVSESPAFSTENSRGNNTSVSVKGPTTIGFDSASDSSHSESSASTNSRTTADSRTTTNSRTSTESRASTDSSTSVDTKPLRNAASASVSSANQTAAAIGQRVEAGVADGKVLLEEQANNAEVAVDATLDASTQLLVDASNQAVTVTNRAEAEVDASVNAATQVANDTANDAAIAISNTAADVANTVNPEIASQISADITQSVSQSVSTSVEYAIAQEVSSEVENSISNSIKGSLLN